MKNLCSPFGSGKPDSEEGSLRLNYKYVSVFTVNTEPSEALPDLTAATDLVLFPHTHTHTSPPQPSYLKHFWPTDKSDIISNKHTVNIASDKKQANKKKLRLKNSGNSKFCSAAAKREPPASPCLSFFPLYGHKSGWVGERERVEVWSIVFGGRSEGLMNLW